MCGNQIANDAHQKKAQSVSFQTVYDTWLNSPTLFSKNFEIPRQVGIFTPMRGLKERFCRFRGFCANCDFKVDFRENRKTVFWGLIPTYQSIKKCNKPIFK